MTRCKAFYRKIKELKDMKEVMKFCSKKDNAVYKMKAHMDFMDRHFPGWDKEECTIVQLTEGATRLLRQEERKNPEVFGEVLDQLREKEEPSMRNVKHIVGKTRLSHKINKSPNLKRNMMSIAEDILSELKDHKESIESRFDVIQEKIEEWEIKYRRFKYVRIDREGVVYCDLSLCENTDAIIDAQIELQHLQHWIWWSRPEKVAESELSDIESDLISIKHVFSDTCLAEKRAFESIGLTRPYWSVPYEKNQKYRQYWNSEYTVKELRTIIQEATDRLLQDYEVLLERREKIRQEVSYLKPGPIKEES